MADQPPDIDEATVAYLERLYRPRHWDPRLETIETHLREAGKVELTEHLRAILEAQKAEDEERAEELARDRRDYEAEVEGTVSVNFRSAHPDNEG